MTNYRAYERHIAHAVEIKFLNNHYITPVTIKFGTVSTDETVNLASKLCKLFAVIKFLDSSTILLTATNKIINHPDKFPMDADYTGTFKVINDRNSRLLRFFVHHDITFTKTISDLKYDDHNNIAALQQLRT